MDADIYIAGITMTPNPVSAGSQFVLSVEVREKIMVLGDDTGILVTENDEMIQTEE